MSDPLTTVQSAYACFGRGDIPALLELLADDVEWDFAGDRKAPYTGRHKGRAQVGEFFAGVAQVDEIQSFEPREFFVGPDHVTVLGAERCTALPSHKVFDSEWVHVWRVGSDGLITRLWGMLDTEASATARA